MRVVQKSGAVVHGPGAVLDPNPIDGGQMAMLNILDQVEGP